MFIAQNAHLQRFSMHKNITHTTCPPRPRPPDLRSVLYRQHTVYLILRALGHLNRAIPGPQDLGGLRSRLPSC
jgi:hypothetical protein